MVSLFLVSFPVATVALVCTVNEPYVTVRTMGFESAILHPWPETCSKPPVLRFLAGMHADRAAKHTVWTRVGPGDMRLRRDRKPGERTGRWQTSRTRSGERQFLIRTALGPADVETVMEFVRGEGRCRTLECGRCGRVVDWVAAKRTATERAKKRMAKVCRFIGDREVEAVLHAGDGCQCRTRRRQTAAQRRAQESMADELEAGTRTLVAWPAHVNDTDLWGRPLDARDRLVARVRACAASGRR